MNFFWIFISFVIFQRLAELFISKRNSNLMFSKGAEEYDKKGYPYIVIMHSAFFVSIILEHELLITMLNKYWATVLCFFIIAQFIRYWAIYTLGTFWNTRIIVLKNSQKIKTGPYKYFAHPNYIAVIIEIAIIPIIFSCYITAAVFSILNVIVLIRRVRLEENALLL